MTVARLRWDFVEQTTDSDVVTRRQSRIIALQLGKQIARRCEDGREKAHVEERSRTGFLSAVGIFVPGVIFD
ncbi:hypothetical protein [Methylobacterium sp. NEAU K]|uniref:hypothetical protein n=1 Tax=Methylobacterium sp. NEAU K TaxID=3064946 RepID=UPI0027323EF5|nr:hypothetical protein [Methylobacterium sp. NEAU K]MDP4004455.1 hypothetical protein [Methylobacterium sp. NEAU K]